MTKQEMLQLALDVGFANAAIVNTAEIVFDFPFRPYYEENLCGQYGGHDSLIVGASGCALCNPCSQTQGLPCKFPDLKYSCMSAYCIFVKKLADECGMEYDCGADLLGLFGMYVFDEITNRHPSGADFTFVDCIVII